MKIDELKNFLENNENHVNQKKVEQLNVLQINCSKSDQEFCYQFSNTIVIIHVMSGTAEIQLEDKCCALKEGEIMLVNLNLAFKIKTKSKNLISLILISNDYFVNNLFNKIAKECRLLDRFSNQPPLTGSGVSFLHFDTRLIDDPAYIVDRILCEYYDTWNLSTVLIESLLLSLLIELERFKYRKEIIKENKPSIESFMGYIKRNYQESSLEKMAEHFNYHPNHLSSRLKRETGQSYLELIHGQRMKVAEVLLITSNLSIEQIAIECGYSSSSFFHKKYKAINKMTPYQFKKSLK